MNRVGADGDLAGLISSAIHGARFHAADLEPYRAASETFGSRLDADSVAAQAAEPATSMEVD